MKKNYLFATIIGMFLMSCAQDKRENDPIKIPSGKTQTVEFNIKGISASKPVGRAAGIPGDIINTPSVIDSLIKNVRILVLEDVTGKCLTYGDFNPIRLSLSNKLYMTVPTGVTLDFIVLTNVADETIMPSSSIIGKNRNDILAILQDDTASGANHYKPAANIFYYNVEDVPVVEDPDFGAGENKANVVLTRIVSQLETTVTKDQVYETDVNGAATGSAIANYIVSVDAIMLRNVSPDINMSRLLNNRAPLKDASNTIVVGSTIDATTPTLPVNKMLSFPNEQLSVFPFVIIKATVDLTKWTAQPSTGTATRYWSLQLSEKFLRENVRLELLIKKLLGPGKIDPPTPSPTSTVEFDITVRDWDPTPDKEEGEAKGI